MSNPTAPVAEATPAGTGNEPATTQEVEDILAAELPAGQDTFDRAYVEKLRKEAATYRTKNKEFSDLGDVERIKQGLQIVEALEKPDGVNQLFWESAQILGFDPDELEDFVSGRTNRIPTTDDGTPATPDAIEAVEELRAEIQSEREERITAERTAVVTSTLDTLKVPDDETVRYAVLSLGNQFVDLDDPRTTTKDIIAAVKKGQEAYVKLTEAEVQRYLASKAEDANQTPTALTGGGSVTGTNPEPPKDVKEAGARAKARLKAKGIID